MKTAITNIEDLRVWQEGHSLTLEVYRITKLFPKEETFGLVSQLRRAASSVPANITEGYYRHTTKEFVQFLYNARGSAGETSYHLKLSKDLEYISSPTYNEFRLRYDNLIKSLNAFIKSLRNQPTNHQSLVTNHNI